MAQPVAPVHLPRPRIFYGWIILLLCFLALAAGHGIRTATGAYLVPWETEFSVSRSVAGAVPMVGLVFYGLFQPFTGKLIDCLGIRPVMSVSMALVAVATLLAAGARQVWQLHLFYGVLLGIGAGGPSSVAAAAAVSHWFVRRRGLAFGLVTTGMSVGQLVLAPLAVYMVAAYGWRISLGTAGLFALALTPVLAVFLRSRPAQMGLRPYGAPEPGAGAPAQPEQGAGAPAPDPAPGSARARGSATAPAVARAGATATPGRPAGGAVWRERSFWFLIVPYFLCGFTTAGLMGSHLVAYAHHTGIDPGGTATAIAVMAVFTALGALISGPLSDRMGRGPVLGMVYAVRLVAFVLALAWVRTPLSLAVFTALFGLTDFATIAPTMAAGTDLFGSHRVGMAAGLLSMGHQTGSAAGAMVPAILFDRTGGYAASLALAIAGMAVAAVLSFLLPRPRAAA